MLTFVRIDDFDSIVEIFGLDDGEDGAEDLLPSRAEAEAVSIEPSSLSARQPENSLVAIHAGVGEEDRRSDKVALGEAVHLDASAVESDLATLRFARGDEGLDALLGGGSDEGSAVMVGSGEVGAGRRSGGRGEARDRGSGNSEGTERARRVSFRARYSGRWDSQAYTSTSVSKPFPTFKPLARSTSSGSHSSVSPTVTTAREHD